MSGSAGACPRVEDGFHVGDVFEVHEPRGVGVPDGFDESAFRFAPLAHDRQENIGELLFDELALVVAFEEVGERLARKSGRRKSRRNYDEEIVRGVRHVRAEQTSRIARRCSGFA